MNDNKKIFDPQQELNKKNIPHLYRWRTLVIFCCGILCISLWAFFCRGCVADTGHSMGFGGGGADFGTGPGSGNSGDGPGAGKTGDGKGKFDSAKGDAGIGKDSGPAGTANPANGRFAVAGTPATPAAPVLTQPPLHIESIAQEVTPPAPVPVVAKRQTGGAPQGRKGFYGVTVRKTAKVLFIVDSSGSMNARSSEMPDKSRLDVMKMELKKAIFSDNVSRSSTGAFGIVRFSSATSLFPPANDGLAKYTSKKDMKEAEEFINNIHAGGGTNMKTAWLAAIEVIKKRNIDTVYFLTDGEPTDGFDPVWLQETIKQNKVRKRLTVNCIALGGRGQGLMQKVADIYKGTFVFIP